MRDQGRKRAGERRRAGWGKPYIARFPGPCKVNYLAISPPRPALACPALPFTTPRPRDAGALLVGYNEIEKLDDIWIVIDPLLVTDLEAKPVGNGARRRKRMTKEGRLMTTMLEIEKKLASLSPGEKAQVLQWVARDVGGASAGIESAPGVCGGEPCIIRTRIPVWILERARQLGTCEADLLRAYPTLRAQDLVNAWAYIETHRQQIEQQIRENEEE